MKTEIAVAALGALAQRSRLAIFRYLVEHAPDGANAGEIAHALAIAPTALTFHIKTLIAAGLVQSEQQGRYVRCRANLTAMNALIAYLTDNCCSGDSARCAPVRGKRIRAAR